MENDHQHLDFLISQYVDGTLDAANRKRLEQQFAASAEARALLQAHREAQDLLDEYGSRIPLIDWDEFDRTLAQRLEDETLAAQRGAALHRWMRPLAVAAALFVAAGIGYAWHAWSGAFTAGNPAAPLVAAPRVIPVNTVRIVDRPQNGPVRGSVTIESPADEPGTSGSVVVIRGDGSSLTPRPSHGAASVTASTSTRPGTPEVPE